MTLLEEAAAEYRKARDANDSRRELAVAMAATKLRTDDIDREVSARSVELAEGFTRLAAIEQNLPPCCCTGRHEPELETGT
jgi:hypothetical protein